MPTAPEIGPCSPVLIVANLDQSLAHYVGRLGFEIRALLPAEAPYFAIAGHGAAQLFLKEIGPDAPPRPNPDHHSWARWDMFFFTPDPDALAEDFASRGAAFHTPLADTDDGLRGFEIRDADGYVAFFGRPQS